MTTQRSEESLDNPVFLWKLARSLLEKHGEQLQNIAVVLPNQRAGLFLQRYLLEQTGRTIWSPVILTFDKLVAELTGLRVLDETDSWLLLYRIYQEMEVTDHDGFDAFMDWAPTALQHFNEIDGYLIDRDHFYNDIRSFEEIESWSLRDDPLTAKQMNLVERWHLHGSLHEAYAQQLLDQGCAYVGLQERVLVQELRDKGVAIPWDHLWFAGLNALTQAEEKILDLFHQNGKCSIAWDVDAYYLRDEMHGAGRSIREHISKWGIGEIEPVDDLLQRKRHVEVAVAPNRMASIQYVVDKVSALTEEQRQRTTVVLAEPGLIAPLLHAIPESIGPLNVTMSIPMDKTPVAGSIGQLLQVNQQLSSGRVRRDTLLDLLSNPVIDESVGRDRFDRMQRSLDENNSVVVDSEELESILESELSDSHLPLCRVILNRDISELPQLLINYLDLIKEGKEKSLLYEQAYQLAHSVKGLAAAWDTVPLVDRNHKVLIRIWQRMLSNTSMGLYGEPLQGLQIMGLLETRSIPLENIILLPANEGSLPPSALERSFIPFDVRRAFGLPMRYDADAVITYHFYRALSACSEMLMIVNGMEGHDSRAPSRFIDQIELELSSRFNPGSSTSLSHTTVQASQLESSTREFTIEKSEKIIARIHEKLTSGLSPSALNTYLRCPLDFYYRYVLRLQEPDPYTADMQQHTLGNVVHSVLEWCYDPENGPITIDSLRGRISEIDSLFKRSIEAENAVSMLRTRRNLFPVHMAKRSVVRLLRQEIGFMKNGGSLQILSVEDKLYSELTLPKHELVVKIGGKVDRVELRNGLLSIIDIKTGSADAKNLKLPSLDYEQLQSKSQATQLLIYAWAYLNTHADIDEISAMVVPARSPSQFTGLPLQVNGSEVITRQMLSEIDEAFITVIESMLDKNEIIRHNEDSTYCKFCVT